MRLLILTDLRSQPIRCARVEQIDTDTWVVPREMMKGIRGKTRDFRVPLSTETQKVLHDALSFSRDGYLSPSARKGVISDDSLS